MNFKQVQHFLHLYKTKHMTRSGKALFISQQGLSRSIQNLEDELGFALFKRTTSGMEPTRQAKHLHDYFLAIAQAYEAFAEEAEKIKPSNQLRVASLTGFAQSIDSGIFSEYWTLHPELDIIYDEHPYKDLLDSLLNDETELGIIIAPVPPTLQTHAVLTREPMYAVMNRNHPFSTKDYILPDDLSGQSLILLDLFDNLNRNFLESAPKDHKVTNTVQISNFLPLIQASKLIGFASRQMFRYYTIPDIIFVPLYMTPDEPVMIQTHLVSRNGKGISPNMESYIQYIMSGYAKDSPP